MEKLFNIDLVSVAATQDIPEGVQGIVDLLSNLVFWGSIVGGGYVIIAILVLGFMVIYGGREGMGIMKKIAPVILIGAACIFGAVAIGGLVQALMPW